MKGILFTPDDIKAIREGRKTVTRRAESSLKVINQEPDRWGAEKDGNKWHFFTKEYFNAHKIIIPRYKVGEILYVKEAWAMQEFAICSPPDYWNSREQSELSPRYHDKTGIWHPVIHKLGTENYAWGLSGEPKWRSPLFMPEWAARDFIKILDAQTQRLQEIIEEDARLEGVNGFVIQKLSGGHDYRVFQQYHHEAYPIIDHADVGDIVRFLAPNMGFAAFQSHNPKCNSGALSIPAKEVFNYIGSIEPDYIRGFRIVWNSINPKYPWESNPWDFRYEFEVVEK